MISDKELAKRKSIYSNKIDRLFGLDDDKLLAEVKEVFPIVEGGQRHEHLKLLLKDGLDKVFKTKWF